MTANSGACNGAFPRTEHTRRFKPGVERRRLATAMQRQPRGLSIRGGGAAAPGTEEQDPTTGVASRALLVQSLQGELARHAVESGGVALVCVDVRRHAFGNDVHVPEPQLRAAARTCVRSARFTDLVARMDGTRFAILLQQASGAVAERVAERLRRRLERLSSPQQPLDVRCAWVSVEAADTPDAETLLQRAVPR